MSLPGSNCPPACHTPAPANCTGNLSIPCDMGSYSGCWMGDYCVSNATLCPPACHIPAPSNCTAGEIACDLGSHAGCWSGDFCLPAGSECPPVCNTPAPSQCQAGEMMCDLGVDAHNCWMGDYCMPAGSQCPPPAGIWSDIRYLNLNIYFPAKLHFLINWREIKIE